MTNERPPDLFLYACLACVLTRHEPAGEYTCPSCGQPMQQPPPPEERSIFEVASEMANRPAAARGRLLREED